MSRWVLMDRQAWNGLCCRECRSALGKPWYFARFPNGTVRMCIDCFGKMRQSAEQRLQEREQRAEQKRLAFREMENAPKIPIRHLYPPYAPVHPVPSDVVLNPSEEAPF